MFFFLFICMNEPLTCHGILPGCVFTLVAVVTGIACRLVVLPLLQRQHVSGRSRGARFVLRDTHMQRKCVKRLF